MSLKIISDVLKYFDFFGARFNFYIEKNRKLYTPLGGLLTLFSCIFGILIFIYINLDDFLHHLPNSTTSTERKNHPIIKFKEEKIWIPWRILDFGGKTINHTNLLYPIIYYYKGIRDNGLKSMITSFEFINYKLCNETSMINNTDYYIIDIELDQLYCIDMEDLNMGGGWDSDFLFLVTFDLYACKNGIDYNEKNKNCTTYKKIAEAAGSNNCFEFEMYYPVVHYQPMNKTTPIFVEYINYFYHLSRFSNKIDRLYLQQHILIDDKGWILNRGDIYSRWGCSSLNGDSYTTGNEKDLMNEGSTSRFYSFNIYLKSDIIYYNRSYKKKLHLIFSDALPIVNIIFIFFKSFAKIFKISSENKKLTELLFENLKEKKIFMKINDKSLINVKRKMSSFKDISQISHINSINNNGNDYSSIQLTPQNSGKKILFENYNNPIANNNQFKIMKDSNSQIINKSSKKDINKSLNNSLALEENKSMNNNVNININYFKNKINDITNSPFENIKIKNDYSSQNNKSLNNITLSNRKSQTHYIKKKLFPYRYYLFSIFIKNIDNSKKSFFFTKKFIVVYNFICQLFDISSYLILQREFQTMKHTVMKERHRNIIEKKNKINVNDRSFNINMKECSENKKFSIFGRLKQMKDIDN